MSTACKGFFITSCLAIITIGCQEEPGPPPPPTKSATNAEPKSLDDQQSSTASSVRKAYSGLKFIIPADWQEVALSQMQMGIVAAKFSMTKAPDVVLTLSRSGGGLEMNLGRWRGQFSASRPENLENVSVAGVQSTLIDLEGGFSPGMGQPPLDSARMLGVIVPLPDQGYFIKLVGPTDQVGAIAEEFHNFLKSAARE